MNLQEFLQSQNIPLDKGLFLVYGKAGVGKTTFLMEFAAITPEKAFIVDTERGFSMERFLQISQKEDQANNLLFTRPEDFTAQAEAISKIISHAPLFSMIGIDTLGKHYREPSKKQPKESNNELARQMRVLKELSRNKPIIVCNQVYQNIRDNIVEPLGKDYVKKWADYIILLDQEQEKRTLKIIKPKPHETTFTFTDKGFLIN